MGELAREESKVFSDVTVKILKNFIKSERETPEMKISVFLLQGLVVMAILAGINSPAFADTLRIPINCQVSVSLMELEEDGPDFLSDTYDITFFGAAAQKPFKKDLFEYGFETGVNLCMENDIEVLSAASGPSGGMVFVEIDNNLFLFDYFAGGYVAVNLAKRFRLYAGAGPLLIYGSLEHTSGENDDDLDDETESQFSGGFYGRAGLEVVITQKFSLGAGVRTITTGLEFDDNAEDIKVEGSQVFVYFSFAL